MSHAAGMRIEAEKTVFESALGGSELVNSIEK